MIAALSRRRQFLTALKADGDQMRMRLDMATAIVTATGLVGSSTGGTNIKSVQSNACMNEGEYEFSGWK